MITHRILPRRSAINFAPMVSICQFIANWLRGLSSRKQRWAKLTKSSRSSVSYALRVNLSAAELVVIPGRTEGPGPETMNTCFANVFVGLCSWLPGARSLPAPRNDGQSRCLLSFYRSSSSQDCRSLVMKVAITSSSAAVNGAGSEGGVTPAFFSASFSMSISILIARKSVAVDLLTS
jgi:hypothetical protein